MWRRILLEQLNLVVLVSSDGIIKTLQKNNIRKNGRIDNRKGKIIKPSIDKYGYYRTTFSNNNKRRTYLVHRLVARAFINNYDENLQVNHIDGNKINNNYKNLEMVTVQENIKHSIETGLKPKMQRDCFGRFLCKKGDVE